MALKISNIINANRIFESCEKVLHPALEKAGIKTIKVDGKDVAATEAPLDAQFAAVFAVNPPGADAQQLSDVLVSNDLISKELEQSKTDLAVARTSVSTLTREKADLESQLADTKSSVSTLTAEKADLKVRKEAAENQYITAADTIKSINLEISKQTVAFNSIDFKAEDGVTPLAANATVAEKLAVAEKIPWQDKLKANGNAVNRAVQQTGVDFSRIPNAGATGSEKKSPTEGLTGLALAMAAHKAAKAAKQ